MKFDSFIKIWAVLLVVFIVIVVGQISNKNPVASVVSMGCEDYTYNLHFNVVPANMTFYTMDDGVQQMFKTDYTIDNTFATILHCGHKYKAVYSADGYQSYTEEFEIGKYIKINPLSTTTKLENTLKEINFVK